MKKQSIDYSLTGMLPDLVKAYLEESNAVQDYYGVPFNLDGIFHSCTTRKFNREDRDLLLAVISEQYQSIQTRVTDFQKVKDHISLLADEKTFTVTTGHQLNLFTGPLYFIYKIASTIQLASQLKTARPEFNFVPVYWMASEDHDIAEINHLNVYGNQIKWEQNKEGAAGKLTCEGIPALVDKLPSLLGGMEHGNSIVALLRKAYTEGRTLSEATRILVNELFGKHGLIILDPDHASLKKKFAEVMIDDAINHRANEKVNSTVASFPANFKAQVHPREINLFYLGDNFRNRIEKKGENFVVLNRDKSFTKDQLVDEIKTHPENFSPNVVLRPLYQEMILPNVAVVGGPGELSYWLEYKSMFDFYKVNFPCLVLRGSAIILETPVINKLNKLGFTGEDILKPSEILVKEFISRNRENGFLTEAREQVNLIFDKVAGKIAEIDVTLKASTEGEKQKSLKSIQALEEKVTKALKRKNETAVSQIEKIKSVLFPGGVMQERHENFITFYAKWGEAFIDELVNELNPLEKKFYLFLEN